MSGAGVFTSVASQASSVFSGAAKGVGVQNAEPQAATPFSGMLKTMVEQTNELDRKASETVTGLLNGKGVEIHDAMIATQKADMAFELSLQVRNKAVAAYQQMMGMQF
ncbi:MAG: flagellar hook-basal body complex protein FliE [Acidobacteria bacterium]|nr:flagellar hook-basal body complex protein FliE [Acidobacteriota bacterium]